MKKEDVMNRLRLKPYRKHLRTYGTSAEAALWKLLKNRQVDGLKFRRQHSIDSYIVDFFCPELKLAIELDGQDHIHSIIDPYDCERTDYLAHTVGIHIIRFENYIVFQRPEEIEYAIRELKKSKE